MTEQAHRMKILISAGETSGDIYAAELIDELLKCGDFEIHAVGGTQTARRPVNMLYDSQNWAAIGYIEAIKQAPRLLLVLRSLKQFLADRRPELLILLDYPGFNMRLAREATRLGIPSLYVFPPSKFAKSPADVADAARNITAVAANFSFTYEVYKAAGANVEFVGHPLIDLARTTMNRDEAFKAFGLDPARPVVGLCPGSRKSELEQLLPLMFDTAKLLLKRDPTLQFVVPVIATEGPDVYGIPKADLRRQIEATHLPVKIIEGRIYDVMAISKVLLISSGTATLEATRIGTPMVIVYRVSLFTEIMAMLFNKLPPYIGLPNILLGRLAIPELIQRNLTPEQLAAQAIDLLENPGKCDKQKRDMAEAISHLGTSGASARIAQMALNLLRVATGKPAGGKGV
ncbi:MAG TPA: lipid-A-disaccharide synthase [Candidatus Ozemobacteraceae bacterium]|nr:lipid-A-disaccharide synthase [Candidatus Ozemobacteraceae bacterium]